MNNEQQPEVQTRAPDRVDDLTDSLKSKILTQFLEREVQPVPFTARIRFDDVEEAYRTWFKDQIVKDHRSELGRFLFGISFTTIGLLLTLTKLPGPALSVNTTMLLVWSLPLLVSSSICGLYLAVPVARMVNPATLDLVKMQHKVGVEIKAWAALWFTLWTAGTIVGYLGLGAV